MKTIDSSSEMQQYSSELKRAGHKISFVPTMGSLHEGHLSLVKKATDNADKVVVSIFVNPAQFGENEDYDKYSRDLEGDLEKLDKYDVDVVFNPGVEQIYPKDFNTYVEVYKLQDFLCGEHRPGHFKGVVTVVLKLFNIVKPDIAVFGEKDYQQLKIIQKMVNDLNLDIEIVQMPIVREEDGLALSSRNSYLSESERLKAVSIYHSLCDVKNSFEKGYVNSRELIKKAVTILNNNDIIDIDYFDIRDGETLELVDEVKVGSVVAVAVRIGNTRLIDNIRL